MEGKHFLKSAALFLLIIAGILAVYAAWNYYYGSRDKINIEQTAKNFEKLSDDIKAALKADTYGGKTPQETLDLFIAALRKEDVDLASKYFMLDLNFTAENQEYFLTRKKWEEALLKAKEDGRLQEIANGLLAAKPVESKEELSNDTKWFEIRDENSDAYQTIVFKLDEESNVWKIESM
ncbi:MAG: hypothetical protein HYT12_03275 [Candidatus Liptonbacteria bacterium]|nr:hypothetical protein [Candidatus Liptonbacteria bacterium]